MSVTININNLSLCHRASGGFSAATLPDVCKTPTPGGPVPLPYPNVATEQDLVKGTSSVHADGGNMCAKYGSEFSKSTGDEPGTIGGVKSGTFIKEATWISYSFNVKLEGKGACRLTDKMFHNHQNTVNAAGKIHPPLSPADQELVDCILQLCKKDKDVVEKAGKLTIYARNPKKVIAHKFTGGKWTEEEKTSLGSAARETGQVWINRGMDCDTVKSTIKHETTHTDQDPKMDERLAEQEAYEKTEQWTIDRGLPGQAGDAFRKRGLGGKLRVNVEAIKEHIRNSYGYNIPKAGGPMPLSVRRVEDGGLTVVLSDGSKRAPEEGDGYKSVPPQDLDEQQIPPESLKCP